MRIDENTKLSLGIVIALLGGATWLTTISLQSNGNAAEINEARKDIKNLESMRTDIEVIRADLKRVLKKLGE